LNAQGEVLLLKRDKDVHCADLWSFPGGKVEANEMPLQAAIREFKEETQLSGKQWRHLGKTSHHYADRTLYFLFFVCFCPDISQFHPESSSIWTKLENISDYPMPEANKKLVPMLKIPEVDDYLRQLII